MLGYRMALQWGVLSRHGVSQSTDTRMVGRTRTSLVAETWLGKPRTANVRQGSVTLIAEMSAGIEYVTVYTVI